MQRDRCSIWDKMLVRNCGVLLQGHAVFGVANSPPCCKEGLGEICSRLCAATSRAALAKCELPEVLQSKMDGVWNVQTLHDRRLAWLPQAPQTRYSVRGVIAIDHTLVTQEGKLIEEVGWFWDHADQRYVSAHHHTPGDNRGDNSEDAPAPRYMRSPLST
jgi:hypothetical protein